jgi:hypothetical protein
MAARTKKSKRICVAAFDYCGWEGWNEWRRERECVVRTGRGKTGLKTGKDCWTDCDFPAECLLQRDRHWQEDCRVAAGWNEDGDV